MRFELKSEADTQALAQEIATELRPGINFGLIGQLGAGKTTFVRHLAESLGSKDQVTSPTFVLQQIYKLPGDVDLEHWDLYRVGAIPDELLEPVGGNVIRVIEWVDRFPELMKVMDWKLRFEFSGHTERFGTVEEMPRD